MVKYDKSSDCNTVSFLTSSFILQSSLFLPFYYFLYPYVPWSVEYDHLIEYGNGLEPFGSKDIRS